MPAGVRLFFSERLFLMKAATCTPWFRSLWLLLAASVACSELLAVTPTREEFALCGQWSETVFGQPKPPENLPGLVLLYQDVPDGVTRGKSWRGTPFQLGNKTYTHGLAFNATKHILVRLGRPADRFTAEVGLENNDDTRRGANLGCGSVTFHVLVAGKELFATPVLRLQDGARPLDVSLGGASEFEIRVGDGGDGRGWDQALWANAVVQLRDGTSLRLQDLPWAGESNANPYAISFSLGHQASQKLLLRWSRQISTAAADSSRRAVIYTDPASGLQVRVESERFSDFPAVEWVTYLKNTARTNSPIIEDLQALDSELLAPGSGSATLHWAKGAVASFDDFAPQETVLQPGVRLHFQPGGGRSSSQVMPFFNMARAGVGIMAAIGWSGEWAADFASGEQGAVSLKAGLALTHLVLHPGEEIRTPRMLLLFYQGDRWRGQNLFRQFVLAHHRPQLNGQPLVAPITCGNWGGTPAEVHLDNIRQITDQKLPLDYYWIDAEWFGKGGWYDNVGNWTLKTNLYPRGFKPLSDALRKSGRELMLWFEPERIFQDTPWQREHPGWLLGPRGDNALLNIGDPAARQFLTEFIAGRIDEFGLGCYRQDFNIDPLPFWQAADAPDRQGISEIHYVEGLYAFWDALRARYPGLLMDNCASGGRRIDLETLGRATPFWRSDGPRDPVAHQCHSYGLLAWVPLSATSEDRAGDDYEFRSSMCSALCLNWWVSGDQPAEKIPANFPWAWARRTLAQYLALRPFYYGDYYPLTAYSQSRDVWMAYQLDRPDLGAGVIVALRRPESPYETCRFALRGLDAQASYRLTNLDTGEKQRCSGSDLAGKGAAVSIFTRPGSILVAYQRE